MSAQSYTHYLHILWAWHLLLMSTNWVHRLLLTLPSYFIPSLPPWWNSDILSKMERFRARERKAGHLDLRLYTFLLFLESMCSFIEEIDSLLFSKRIPSALMKYAHMHTHKSERKKNTCISVRSWNSFSWFKKPFSFVCFYSHVIFFMMYLQCSLKYIDSGLLTTHVWGWLSMLFHGIVHQG